MEQLCKMRFSDWLLAELSIRKWTQTDLANNSGLTKQAITNYANGRIPDADAIKKIARAFKKRADYVFRISIGESPDENIDEWIEAQSHILTLIPPELRSTAARVIESFANADEAERTKIKEPKGKIVGQ